MTSESFRSITSTERVAAHLAACFDGLYRGLGERAPQLSDDTYVVVTHEMSRAFGAQRDNFLDLLAHRAGTDPLENYNAIEIIDDVISQSVLNDGTGALTLYSVAMLIGPRVLISLRDARESASPTAEGALISTCQVAAGILVGEIRRIGEVARSRSPHDDASWLEEARKLDELIIQAGYGESFGLGTVG